MSPRTCLLTMKSLLSLSVMVPSKSVKNMNFGFLNGQFMAFSSDADTMAAMDEIGSVGTCKSRRG